MNPSVAVLRVLCAFVVKSSPVAVPHPSSFIPSNVGVCGATRRTLIVCTTALHPSFSAHT